VSINVTILGCGAAGGVPSISEGWGLCDPKNPKNSRRRASILVQDGHSTVLVDASPDLRVQLLDCGATKLDGVVFTHAHADHIHGLDELREVNRVLRAPLDVYTNSETQRDLELRFGYAFEGIAPGEPIFRPWLIAHQIGEGAVDTFMVKTLQVKAFRQDHGFSTTLGLRFGDLVYSTDVVNLPDEAKAVIRGAHVWIVGAIALTPHPTHAHLDKVLSWVDELKPRRTIITHMGPKMDYDVVNAHCPVGVTAAFDGMTLEI
jgi:phosphoribosyl 1,2-cyclic phosphate phosphodiesterase